MCAFPTPPAIAGTFSTGILSLHGAAYFQRDREKMRQLRRGGWRKVRFNRRQYKDLLITKSEAQLYTSNLCYFEKMT